MNIHSVLQQYWGFSQFRPLQEDIIQSVLDGKDTLALLPTGGGKSLCFQVPALLQDGICIVVSPLIALMRDQVENLKVKGIKALSIVSGMGKREIGIALDNCIYGDYKFLYLSPERLQSELVRERIRHMNVNLIAIDEAHCISQWGYDFRPSYLLLKKIRELKPTVPVLALTASATARVALDIQEKLDFKNSSHFRKSFERSNLNYLVYEEDDKLRKLLKIARSVKGSGIVYVRNRRECQEIAKILNSASISADFYHAGLEPEIRTEKQTAWKSSKTRIIVATNAFGMGIDKPDVRFVVHLDLPESLEAYYQEAGRAGRDEKKSYAVLLWNKSDKIRLLNKQEKQFPPITEIRNIYHQLGNYYQLAYGSGEGLSLDFDLADFCSRFKLDAVKTIHALKFLEHDGYLILSESVFLPSRIQVLASAEDLYRFQVEQPAYDTFIKILLRSYGGIFDQYVSVKEADLAKRTGINRIEVGEMLSKLNSLELISYVPQTDKPILTFLRERVDSRQMTIDGKYIADRQQISKIQIESVINYAQSFSCRSSQILLYFDEPNPKLCGTCDVCILKNRESKKELIRDEIIKEIFAELSEAPLQLKNLIPAVKTGNENEKLEVLRILLDAGSVKSNGDFYYL